MSGSLDAALDEHERRREHDRRPRRSTRTSIEPQPQRRALVEGIEEGDEADGDEAEAERSRCLWLAPSSRDSGVVRLTSTSASAHSGMLTQKIAGQPRELDEAAGDGGGGGLTDGGGGHPGAERRDLLAGRELERDDGERRRQDRGGADAHQGAADDEHRRVGSERGERRRRRRTSTRPMSRTRRRPKMSPKRPAAMTSAPQTSVKIVLTHCRAVTDPPMSSEIAVVATGMFAAANQTMAAERQRATSDHQRRAPATVAAPPGAAAAVGEAAGAAACGRRAARRLAVRAHFCSAIPAMNRASASVQRSSSPRSTLSLGAWILHCGSSAPQRIISAPGMAPRNAATSGIEPPSP